MYTSDLPEAVADVPGSLCEQFADYTNLTSINSRADLRSSHQPDSIVASRVASLCQPPKTVVIESSGRAQPTPLSIKVAQDALAKVQSHEHLGAIFSHDLHWDSPVDYNNILTKATRLLLVLKLCRLRSSMDQESLSHLYLTYTSGRSLSTPAQRGSTKALHRLTALDVFKGEQLKPSSVARSLCPVTMMNSWQPLAGFPWHQERNTSR